MIALEITINGQQTQTIAVGDFGYVCAEVFWVRLRNNSDTLTEELRMHPYGYDPSSREWLHWPNTDCKVGDEITIRIVDVAEWECDQASERFTKRNSFASDKLENKMRGMEEG